MAVAAPRSGFRTLLRKRNFVLLWMAQLISMTIQPGEEIIVGNRLRAILSAARKAKAA